MPKITIGQGITSALRYAQGPGKDENGVAKTAERSICLGGTGFGFDPQTLHQQEIARRLMEQNGRYEMQGSPTKQCLKDCQHISLSWAPGQTPNQAEKLEAAKHFLKALGMENSMTMIYEHTDRSHAHIHLVSSRINPEPPGLAYDEYQNRYKVWHAAIEWDRRMKIEKGEPIPKNLQWCHDRADAARGEVDRERLLELLLKNNAVVRKTGLDQALAFGGHFGSHLEAHREDFIRHHDLIKLKKYRDGPTAAYTTKEIYQEETQTLSRSRRLKERAGYGVDEATLKRFSDEMTLTKEQRAAVWDMTRDNGLGLLSGEAGTGKSRTLQAIRRSYERQGHRVKGLAFTNKVALDLQRDGFDSDTIAAELQRVRTLPWNDKTVLMVDEAAQLSTKDLNDLFMQADRHKAKVILTGHDKQLGSIEKGGLFPVMERRFGSTKLTEIHRTKDPEQKRAYNKMANRKFKEAVDIFRESGSVRWNASREDSIRALTHEYAKDFRNDPDQTRKIIAPTNDDVDKLNLWARELLKNAGKIGPEVQLETSRGEGDNKVWRTLPFGVGDRLVMNETVDKKKGLVNGAFGTVLAVDRNELELKIDTAKGQPEKVFKIRVGQAKEQGEVASIGHGYASTVYKSQGDSIDRVYVMHDHRATAPSNYVALTRHIERVRLYVSREQTNSFEELAEQLKHGHDKTAAHSYLLDDEGFAKAGRPVQALDRPAPTLAPELYTEPLERVSEQKNTHNEITPQPQKEKSQMFTQHKIRDVLHRVFGSKEEKSRGSAVNTMFAAHIYENWGPPAENDPLKWHEFINRPEQEPKPYREIIRELFGKGEAERGDDFKDRTSATIPGLLPPSAREIEDHEMGR